MSEIKWIKMATNIFDNRKIKQIECLPDGDRIITIWLKILCLAGNINDSGMVYFTQDVPYTDQMLSVEFNRPIAIIQLALGVFQKFGMIDIVDDIIRVSNWEKYQSTAGLERIREQGRARVAEYRIKKRLSDGTKECNATCNVTVTHCNGTEEDIDKEQDKEQDKEDRTHATKRKPANDNWQTIIDDFNRLCPSLPAVKSLSDERKSNIKARLSEHDTPLTDIFEKIEASDFLTGRNGKWQATFDWIFKKANYLKIIEGNYDNKTTKGQSWENEAFAKSAYEIKDV